MRFYLRTHQPAWLARSLGIRLLVSHRRLAARRSLPRATGPWALDSGGFTELSLHGRWRTDAHAYATAVRRYAVEIGQLDWAAPQDWMTEDHVLARTVLSNEIGNHVGSEFRLHWDWLQRRHGGGKVQLNACLDWRLASRRVVLKLVAGVVPKLAASDTRTGCSLRTHQQRTVDNYLRLRELAAELPIIPVLQGQSITDYHRCADLYERRGVELATLPLVGVGSVCRRQHTGDVEQIVRSLAARGLRLHGFGIKITGLTRYADALASSDSAAWSLRGRHVPGCSPSHRSESNCLRFTLDWHTQLRQTLPTDSRDRPNRTGGQRRVTQARGHATDSRRPSRSRTHSARPASSPRRPRPTTRPARRATAA